MIGAANQSLHPARPESHLDRRNPMHKKHANHGGFFEHKSQKPLSSVEFKIRLYRYVLGAVGLIVGFLGVGILGYHYLESMSWIDSFLNAAMILGGMGPVDTLKTSSGKIFAGIYALASGIIFLVVAGLFFTPIIHRLLHKFHFEEDLPGDSGRGGN